MATLGRILAEEIHKTPSKTLAGDDSNATTRHLPGRRQDPCQGHQQGHCQAHISQDSTAVRMQLPAQPAGQAPVWQHAASRTNHKHLRGGMQIFMKVLPSCHLSCLPAYMALHASLVWVCVKARRSGDR